MRLINICKIKRQSFCTKRFANVIAAVAWHGLCPFCNGYTGKRSALVDLRTYIFHSIQPMIELYVIQTGNSKSMEVHFSFALLHTLTDVG